MSGVWVVTLDGLEIMRLAHKPPENMDTRLGVRFEIDWLDKVNLQVSGEVRAAQAIVKMMPEPEASGATRERTLSDVLKALVSTTTTDSTAAIILTQLSTKQRQKGIEHVIRGKALGTLEQQYEAFGELVAKMIEEAQ